MPRPHMRAAWTCLLLALLAGDALAGARDEVIAASQKLLALKTYHVTMTHAGKGPATTEADFVAPDRYRLQMPTGTQVIVGDTMYLSIEGRTMKVPLQKGMLTQWRDPMNLRANAARMTATALGSEPVDDRPAKKYAIANADAPDMDTTMWVGGNGLPVKIVTRRKGSGPAAGTTTLRYSRFDDPAIRIATPK